MDVKHMATLESTGTSSEIKEQYEKHEKVCWVEFFFYSLPLYTSSLYFIKPENLINRCYVYKISKKKLSEEGQK